MPAAKTGPGKRCETPSGRNTNQTSAIAQKIGLISTEKGPPPTSNW
ncbi:MAG: hypothetical protein BWX70_03476 [Verrucomicrobia bacterium ADurb.Bin070]|nr:MAG: hypothetical protein BWX70_03476 [Verrucomicrobia bacterium ADurb.Bin070]